MAPTTTKTRPSPARFLPPDSNPFATRFTRPGAQPFLFDGNENAHAIVKRLEENSWWGQIVGPHGSGKSTLISTLEPALDQHGREVIHLRMHDHEHELPSKLFSSNDWRASTQLVVDGYEQLGRFNRWRLKRHCRRRSCGLLVTTHEDLGLPTIFTTKPTPEATERLVAQLLDLHGHGNLVGTGPYASSRIDDAFRKHHGDVREVLFELYDLYESNRTAAS
ncbi:MAG: hypothetical protein MI757_04980 [Pirellulales bacterium]|nr:hypothetical protein [Pirellulales bacterium]